MAVTYSNGTTWSATGQGIILDAEKGERPKETPNKLISTRAVELQDGWVGQIIMGGEIVHQTEPKQDTEDDDGSDLVLEEVNQHILDAFKKLIVG